MATDTDLFDLYGEKSKAQGVSMLVVHMLRDQSYLQTLSREKALAYIYRVGVVLHNLPFHLITNDKLTSYQLMEINAIDPSAIDGEWGCWVKEICSYFDQIVPEYPVEISKAVSRFK